MNFVCFRATIMIFFSLFWSFSIGALHAEQARPIGSGSATRDLWPIVDHQGPIEKRVRDHVTEFKRTARAAMLFSVELRFMFLLRFQ